MRLGALLTLEPPIPYPDAPVSTMNVSLMSGKSNIGASIMASLSVKKASRASIVHLSESFFNNDVGCLLIAD